MCVGFGPPLPPSPPPCVQLFRVHLRFLALDGLLNRPNTRVLCSRTHSTLTILTLTSLRSCYPRAHHSIHHSPRTSHIALLLGISRRTHLEPATAYHHLCDTSRPSLFAQSRSTHNVEPASSSHLLPSQQRVLSRSRSTITGSASIVLGSLYPIHSESETRKDPDQNP